ncbi:Aste57867_14216 [Aphanomyces stellatus]|uniref:Aste57867_14216 protein n=1 Tax=Aphanomyces stellatus TaxID=120398 RepID=A0A485L2C2_9STRA|nr:hypothetical protein As57867_014165 [Aphanomyces stellatus]VFT91041.1 Aste57867_14216 [Aphanomyces stellatus]
MCNVIASPRLQWAAAPTFGGEAPFQMRRTSTLDDIAADVPLSWRRILLAISSYLLFFTDIPRSGYGFRTIPYPAVSTHKYSLFAYNYRIAKIHRNTTTGVFAGFNGSDSAISSVPVWAYKFDSTSVGLRTFVHQFDPSSWDPCLAYESTCASQTLNISTVFAMVDAVVTVIASQPRPVAYSVQFLLVDHIDHIFSVGMFAPKQWRVVQGHLFHNPTQDSICDPTSPTTPHFCHLPWSNFQHLGAGLSPLHEIADYVRAKAQTYSLGPNQTLQVAVIVSTPGFIRDAGGIADASTKFYDVVALFRVQTCDNATCTTDTVEDYRFEGSILDTNSLMWYRTVRLLRFVGQMYNICRVVALFYGCYTVVRSEPQYASVSARVLATFQLGLRIPVQVVIYGSWLPVLLFVIAHTIDSTMLYTDIYTRWISVLGSASLSPIDIVQVLSCHMRNVWLVSLVAKLSLLPASIDTQRVHGVLGVRGYVIILASFLSIFLDTRVDAIRSTMMQQVTVIPPSLHFALLRITTSLPFQRNNNGIWLDFKTLVLSGFVVFLILRVKFKHAVLVPTSVPHCVLIYSSSLLFSTSWFGAILDPLVDKEGRVQSVTGFHNKGRQSVHSLMNLAWMTDPLLYAMVRWRSPAVYLYKRIGTHETFYHPLPLKMMAKWKDEDEDMFALVEKRPFVALSWGDQIRVE